MTIILLIFGFLIGAVGTLVGLGGGIFTVSFLIITQGFSSQLAVGTSLLVILCNSASGTIAYAVQRRINYKLGLFFGMAVIPGIFLGTYVAELMPTALFKQIFALVLIVVAIVQLFAPNLKNLNPAPSEGNIKPQIRYPILIMLISLATGFIAALLGIGGGIIHIPVLIFIVGLSVHRATATSHFILVITSLVALFTHGWLDNVDYRTGLLLGIGAIAGAQLGAYLSNHTRPRIIILILSVILVLAAIRMLIKI